MKDTEIKNFFYRLQSEKSDNNDEEDNVLLFLLWLFLLITILLYIWRFTISKDEKTVVLIMDVATRGGTMPR